MNMPIATPPANEWGASCKFSNLETSDRKYPAIFFNTPPSLPRTLQPEKTENAILAGEPKIWTIVQIFGFDGLGLQF